MRGAYEREEPRGDRWLAGKLTVLVAVMFGFGFALVPLYDVFCDITGIGGRTASTAAEVTERPDPTRVITLELMASVNESAPWRFQPATAKMRVHPGKLYMTTFFAENLARAPLVGQAVPSVAPGYAAKYLQKTECFCFELQRFDVGEARDMPVRFIIDPELPAHIETLTLSYTFFDTTELAATD